MGSLGVVALDEVVEPSLLLQDVVGGGFGGFLLEGQVHALVASVLLGVSWFDAFDVDAQAEPPDGEPAEAEQGIGACEGHAIVGADGPGQAEVLEGPLEDVEGIDLLGCGESASQAIR